MGESPYLNFDDSLCTHERRDKEENQPLIFTFFGYIYTFQKIFVDTKFLMQSPLSSLMIVCVL